MRLVTSARMRAVGLLLLEATGIALVVVRQRHEKKVRREAAVIDFAERVYDFAKGVTKP
jgi:hypothetical protein